MRRIQWTLRDLFWLVILAALAAGWWADANARNHEARRQQIEFEDLQASAARAEEMLGVLGYRVTLEQTVHFTPPAYWPARQSAERTIQKLLSGKQDSSATLPLIADSLSEFQFGDVVEGQVDPCRSDRAEFTISLSGKTRNAHMTLFLKRDAAGKWHGYGVSAIR